MGAEFIPASSCADYDPALEINRISFYQPNNHYASEVYVDRRLGSEGIWVQMASQGGLSGYGSTIVIQM